MKIVLRPWEEDDLMFSLKVRNHPLLMKWFRQDEPISVEQQRRFILHDVEFGGYNGMVVEVDGVPAGLCGVKNTREFTLGILPEWQHKGIATRVMEKLIEEQDRIWSEVFVGNPALEWFIAKLRFKVRSVKERAYHKQGVGLVDVVEIYHA